MVEAGRTDYRDVLMTISLLHHTARRVGAAPEKLFREAAAVADKDTAALLAGFIRRPARDKDLRASWGREEVETEGGVGFIGWDFKKYDPACDMKKLAVDVARLVAADKYRPTSVAVASDLPSVWLETGDNKARLGGALRRARAGANVHAALAVRRCALQHGEVLQIVRSRIRVALVVRRHAVSRGDAVHVQIYAQGGVVGDAVARDAVAAVSKHRNAGPEITERDGGRGVRTDEVALDDIRRGGQPHAIAM